MKRGFGRCRRLRHKLLLLSIRVVTSRLHLELLRLQLKMLLLLESLLLLLWLLSVWVIVHARWLGSKSVRIAVVEASVRIVHIPSGLRLHGLVLIDRVTKPVNVVSLLIASIDTGKLRLTARCWIIIE